MTIFRRSWRGRSRTIPATRRQGMKGFFSRMFRGRGEACDAASREAANRAGSECASAGSQEERRGSSARSPGYFKDDKKSSAPVSKPADSSRILRIEIGLSSQVVSSLLQARERGSAAEHNIRDFRLRVAHPASASKSSPDRLKLCQNSAHELGVACDSCPKILLVPVP